MANIKISDLKIPGSDLFTDSEDYLQYLSQEDIEINAGLATAITILITEPGITTITPQTIASSWVCL